jgi:hypothetical protein
LKALPVCGNRQTVIHLGKQQHGKGGESMKKTNRFALLAVLGAVLGSALIMGCGGGAEDDTAATNNTAGAGAADAGEE